MCICYFFFFLGENDSSQAESLTFIDNVIFFSVIEQKYMPALVKKQKASKKCTGLVQG